VFLSLLAYRRILKAKREANPQEVNFP
jgi:hypothetical protein